jgi:NDP-sugar pyrophosphorylase family protein
MQFEAFCLSLKSDTDRREHMCNVFNNMEIDVSFFDAVELTGKFSMIDAYLQLAQHYAIHYYDHSDGILLDVGKPESLEKANSLFKP